MTTTPLCRVLCWRGFLMSQLYTKMVWLTVGCTVGYPLIWLFSEGFGNFSVSFEVAASHLWPCCCLDASCYFRISFACSSQRPRPAMLAAE